MRLLIACLALAAPPALSACGFKPVYAENTGVARQLSGMKVETGDGRPSYALGLALKDELGTWQGQPRYILRTSIDMSRQAQSITVADIATRYEMFMQVNYAVYDAASGERLETGEVSGRAAYDVPLDPYAAIRAEQESEERAARDAAHQIVMDLTRALSQPGES